MDYYVKDILGVVINNDNFRHVIKTGEEMQVVVMSLLPGEDIGTEIHEHNEQLLVAVEGSGMVVVDGVENDFNEGDMVLVRAGHEHNFINTGATDLKIITIYSPPHHKDDTIHKIKAEAEEDMASE